MGAIKEKRHWPVALVIIGVVVAVSLAIYFISWNAGSRFHWGWLVGLPVGIIVCYGWCLLIYSLALRLLGSFSDSWRALRNPDNDRKFSFLFYLAILYIPIGEAYGQLIWQDPYHVKLVATMSHSWQIAAMSLPVAMIFLVSFVIAYAELRWGKKQSAVMAVFQSVFTLLWLQPFLPYLLGQVR